MNELKLSSFNDVVQSKRQTGLPPRFLVAADADAPDVERKSTVVTASTSRLAKIEPNASNLKKGSLLAGGIATILMRWPGKAPQNAFEYYDSWAHRLKASNSWFWHNEKLEIALLDDEGKGRTYTSGSLRADYRKFGPIKFRNKLELAF